MTSTPCLVLLFPEDQADAPLLEAQVRKQRDCKVETIVTTPALLSRLKSGRVDGLFCSIRHFDLPFLNILGKVQAVAPSLVTVVLSDSIDERAQVYLKRLEKIIHLEKPMPIKAISQVCEKLVQGHAIHERKHKRYPTDQPAEIEILETREILKGRLYNMSQGGAYLELDSGEVQPKIAVKLTVSLDALKKERVVHAKVAWIMKKGFNAGKFGVGLEFVNINEAYLSLIDPG